MCFEANEFFWRKWGINTKYTIVKTPLLNGKHKNDTHNTMELILGTHVCSYERASLTIWSNRIVETNAEAIIVRNYCEHY